MQPDIWCPKFKSEVKDGLLKVSFSGSTRAPKVACALSLAASAACAPLPEPAPLEPAPFVNADRPAPRGTPTQHMIFRASEMTDGPHKPVAAMCTIKGEGFRARFQTPATLAIPTDREGLTSCKFGEEVAEWIGFPTKEASWALILFRGAAEAEGKKDKRKTQVVFGDQSANFVIFPESN
ncbi:hypothetical protein [Leisingera sp. F5]|uniref:hypothetical protein n=1 Tax=Leisingera sp. F5 TaxID=1813816 RepID=UPI000AA62471|nr:hypothetical protein [Leisingera sp. F5]